MGFYMVKRKMKDDFQIDKLILAWVFSQNYVKSETLSTISKKIVVGWSKPNLVSMGV